MPVRRRHFLRATASVPVAVAGCLSHRRSGPGSPTDGSPTEPSPSRGPDQESTPSPDSEFEFSTSVTAEAHRSDEYTLQDAFDDVPAAGGAVVLGPGTFEVDGAETPAGVPIEVTGSGRDTTITGTGGDPPLRFSASRTSISTTSPSSIRTPPPSSPTMGSTGP